MAMKALLDAIDSIPTQKKHPVLFLSGLGGMGKTTFAHKVEERRKSVVVETDWYLTYATEDRKMRIAYALASGNPERIQKEENPLHWYSWDLFTEDILGLQKNGSLKIKNAWNQKTGGKDLNVDLHLQGEKDLIMCDGIYLLHPPLTALADYIVLLEGGKELSQERTAQRDAHRSSPEYLAYKAELLEKYDLPYVERYRKNADCTIKDFGL